MVQTARHVNPLCSMILGKFQPEQVSEAGLQASDMFEHSFVWVAKVQTKQLACTVRRWCTMVACTGQGWRMTPAQMKYISLHDRQQKKYLQTTKKTHEVRLPLFSDKIDHANWMNLVISHEQRAPVATQRSWFLCQYSYCAERSFARRAAEPTRQFWLIWTRSFKNLQVLSITWVPALQRIDPFFPGTLWVTTLT